MHDHVYGVIMMTHSPLSAQECGLAPEGHIKYTSFVFISGFILF